MEFPVPLGRAFQVNYNMNFREPEVLRVYVFENSWSIPDPETLLIPLMQCQCIGLPMRQSEWDDWFFLSYQDLDMCVPVPIWPWMRMRLHPNFFFVLGQLLW